MKFSKKMKLKKMKLKKMKLKKNEIKKKWNFQHNEKNQFLVLNLKIKHLSILFLKSSIIAILLKSFKSIAVKNYSKLYFC